MPDTALKAAKRAVDGPARALAPKACGTLPPVLRAVVKALDWTGAMRVTFWDCFN